MNVVLIDKRLNCHVHLTPTHWLPDACEEISLLGLYLGGVDFKP